MMGTGERILKIGQVETLNLQGGVKVDRRLKSKEKQLDPIKCRKSDCFQFNEKTGEWNNPKVSKNEFEEQQHLNESLASFEANLIE